MIELTSSQLSYLTAIYEISKQGKITVTKIANYLNCSKPSVVKALKKLDELNIIIYNNDEIKITELGKIQIKNIYRKSEIFSTFLIDVLNISETLAQKDSEVIKNKLSCFTINKLEKYLEQELNKRKKTS